MTTRVKNDYHDDYEVEVHEEVVHMDGVVPVDRHERVEVIRDGDLERRQRIVEDRGAMRRATLYKLTRLIWLLAGVLETGFLLRLAFKMIAANPAAPFVAFVYGVTGLFLWPFSGMVADPAATNGMVLEVTTFVAMIVYALLTWILVKVIYWASTPGPWSGREVHIERHERL